MARYSPLLTDMPLPHIALLFIQTIGTTKASLTRWGRAARTSLILGGFVRWV